jgi:hypothetical protein
MKATAYYCACRLLSVITGSIRFLRVDQPGELLKETLFTGHFRIGPAKFRNHFIEQGINSRVAGR